MNKAVNKVVNKTVFEYQTYKSYLNEFIKSRPKSGHGFKSTIAKAIGCPVSHISQVLTGNSHLSFEQAEEVNHFFGHTKEEAGFFLMLVQYERAGTPRLKKRLENQISQVLRDRLVLKDRLKIKKSVSLDSQAQFYSGWYYAAVHIILTIEEYQTSKEAISHRLGISAAKVSEILEFLVSIGLVTQEGGQFKTTDSRIHLGSDSPVIANHHTNWRMKAIRSLEKDFPTEALHYSSVITISLDDALKIKSLLVKQIESLKTIIKDSNSENIFCLNMDFFEL